MSTFWEWAMHPVSLRLIQATMLGAAAPTGNAMMFVTAVPRIITITLLYHSASKSPKVPWNSTGKPSRNSMKE